MTHHKRNKQQEKQQQKKKNMQGHDNPLVPTEENSVTTAVRLPSDVVVVITAFEPRHNGASEKKNQELISVTTHEMVPLVLKE